MGKRLDLTGQKFGKLTAIEKAENKVGKYPFTQWVCECECGNKVIVTTNDLRTGHTKSCGCINSTTRNRKMNLVGKRFGRLTVVAFDHYDRDRFWTCKCDCGNTTVVRSAQLLQGKTQSCGCLQREAARLSHTTHGGTRHGWSSRLYQVYAGIKSRCYNPNDVDWKWYGGKGVKMCDEWLHDYGAFREWAYANGYDETTPLYSHQCTIDRINPYGNYEPSNCRWVDSITQANNKRSKYDKNTITA